MSFYGLPSLQHGLAQLFPYALQGLLVRPDLVLEIVLLQPLVLELLLHNRQLGPQRVDLSFQALILLLKLL